MPKKKKPKDSSDTANDTFENLQLKKRILELEKQLKDAEMKAIAFSTMVDIAEKEFEIPIRKKLNTKP
jgi:cell division septum initiation protein DivIVA